MLPLVSGIFDPLNGVPMNFRSLKKINYCKIHLKNKKTTKFFVYLSSE
jgi:hypothetical protein